MGKSFLHVPDEVCRIMHTGIFWISYTHLTAHAARFGISQTKKIMAPSISLAHDVVPFSGEPDWRTYSLRMYHVSVSVYPPSEHSWRMYHDRLCSWTPESGQRYAQSLEQELAIRRERLGKPPKSFGEYLEPEQIRNDCIKLDECLRLEQRRQETYPTLSPEEREAIAHPRPDLYLFGETLDRIATRKVAYKSVRAEHPFAPAEIKLERHLIGMFTSQSVGETHEWISGLIGRDIPVASIDALATWEQMFPKLPSFTGYTASGFYFALLRNREFQQQVIREICTG